MRDQCLAPDLFPHQISMFSLQRVSTFFGTLTTTDQQRSLLAGSDRHVLGVRYKASPRARRHRNPRRGLWTRYKSPRWKSFPILKAEGQQDLLEVEGE